MMTQNADKNRNQIHFFCMDDIVPKDHLLRLIERAINWFFIYELVEEKYSPDHGRPSIDPVVLIKIPLIQYLYGIKSMRQTIKEIEVNVAYRWFLGLEIQDRVPHFSTFGKNYTRRFKDTDLFERIFSHILEQCYKWKFVDPSEYAKGMTTGDIESHMRELYDIDISDSTISRITDKILPIVKEWQERPLEEVYAVVFMDAIHYHVRSEGRIVKRAVYIALGIDMNGKRDVLGMYVGENESAKFRLSIMNGLKNRGVEDILIACVDGLSGFPQAIEAVYPQTEIQQCIIHQIRNTTKFVSYKDIKKLMSDLKQVYAAPTEEISLNQLELFKDKWDSKYPKIYKSWHDNRATLSTYFKYPEAVRRLIYTTNAIEGFNRQLRKVTKSKTVTLFI